MNLKIWEGVARENGCETPSQANRPQVNAIIGQQTSCNNPSFHGIPIDIDSIFMKVWKQLGMGRDGVAYWTELNNRLAKMWEGEGTDDSAGSWDL